MSNRKKKVLFVGSFKDTARDGSVGGQMFACKSLISSSLSNKIEWTLLDTTSESSIPDKLSNRSIKAAKRTILFFYYLLTKRIDYVLIFTADGWSFVEKGLMALLGRIFRRKVILAPRAGSIANDIVNSSFFKWYIPFVFRKCNKVICQSNYWKNLFEESVPGRKDIFYVIENWIDIDNYINIPLSNHNNKVVILFLSWVEITKGVMDLMEATLKLKESGISNFHLIVAGDGMALKTVSRFIKENDLNDNVELTGWAVRERKFELLRKSDIYVLPSYFEGYPNSLVEAMISGKACIATKVGAIPDILSDSTNGFLIDSQNSDQLFEKLAILIRDKSLRLKFASKARDQITKRNSIEQAVEHFYKILS